MSVWSELNRPVPAAPPLLHRDEVFCGAWTGLLLDGAYLPIGWDVAVRADLECTPELRAQALVRRVPRRAVIGRLSAVWVHLGGSAPPRLELLVGPGARRVDPRPDLQSHEATLADGDVDLLDGVPVTSVQRTGVDVARYVDGPQADRCLHRLVDIGLDVEAALGTLGGLGRARGTRRAAARLGRLRADGRLPRSLGPGDPVDVVDTFHLADRGQDRRQVRRLSHLEHEPGQRHPVT